MSGKQFFTYIESSISVYFLSLPTYVYVLSGKKEAYLEERGGKSGGGGYGFGARAKRNEWWMWNGGQGRG